MSRIVIDDPHSGEVAVLIDDPHSGEVVVTSEARKRALEWFTKTLANRIHGEVKIGPSRKLLWPQVYTPEQVEKMKKQYASHTKQDH